MKEGSINFYFLLSILLKNIVWILLAAVLGGTLMYAYSSHTAVTTYTSSLKILVRNVSLRDEDENVEGPQEDDKVSYYSVYGLTTSAISASKSLIETYTVIIQTEDSLKMFLEDIQANNGYELTYVPVEDDAVLDNEDWYTNMGTWEVRGSLNISAVGDTEVMQVNVTTTDYRKTEAISKAIENKIQEVINENYDIGSVHVIESPSTPYRIPPAHVRNVIIGVAAGFVIAALAFFVAAYVDNTVKCETDIKEAMGVLPLGEIPDFVEVHKSSYKYYNSRYSKYGYRSYKKGDE